jgi:hypothetical protein
MGERALVADCSARTFFCMDVSVLPVPKHIYDGSG